MQTLAQVAVQLLQPRKLLGEVDGEKLRVVEGPQPMRFDADGSLV